MAVLAMAVVLGMAGAVMATWLVKDAEKHYNEIEQFDRQIAEVQKMLKANELLHK